MNWEIYLKRKACVSDSQSIRRRVAYVTGAKTVEEAIAIALARRENAAFMLDGTPRRSSH